jgi:hypothetical protein
MNNLSISRTPAAAGMAWIKQGWHLFKQAPIPWTGMTALVFLVLMAVGMVPLAGLVAVHVLSPFIVAGYMAASRGGSRGETVSFIYLAAGWRENRNRNTLLLVGALYMLGTLLIFELVKYFTNGDMQALLQQTQNPAAMTPEQAEQILATALPAMALGSLLFAPLLMATWFAPALVLFENFPAGKSLWWSLWACWVNWRSILLYSLVLGMIGMVALILPFGLGLLIFVPWTLASTYAAYEDIFLRVEPDDAPMDAA